MKIKLKNIRFTELQYYVNNQIATGHNHGRSFRRMKRELQRRLGYSNLDRLIDTSNKTIWITIYALILGLLLILSLFMVRSPLSAYFWYRALSVIPMGIAAVGLIGGFMLLYTGMIYGQKKERDR